MRFLPALALLAALTSAADAEALDRIRPLVSDRPFAVIGVILTGLVAGLVFCGGLWLHQRARWPWLVAPFVVAFLFLGVAPALAVESDGTEPDPVLTPGAVRTTDKAEICGEKTSTVRNVSGAEKLAVYRRYGMAGPNAAFPGTNLLPPYEIDHVISLELGGSNDITNLWPQSYVQPMGAHEKDALENRLHKLVCGGQISVEDAQHDIATDWIAAYRKYVAPDGTSQ